MSLFDHFEDEVGVTSAITPFPNFTADKDVHSNTTFALDRVQFEFGDIQTMQVCNNFMAVARSSNPLNVLRIDLEKPDSVEGKVIGIDSLVLDLIVGVWTD
jgi:hypothetical protein